MVGDVRYRDEEGGVCGRNSVLLIAFESFRFSRMDNYLLLTSRLETRLVIAPSRSLSALRPSSINFLTSDLIRLSSFPLPPVPTSPSPDQQPPASSLP